MKKLRFVLMVASLVALALLIFLPDLRVELSLTAGPVILAYLYFLLKKENIPSPFLIVFLLFLGLFSDALGNILGFFDLKIGPLWYDDWMHIITPIYIAFASFWVFKHFQLQQKISLSQPLLWIFAFSVAFSLTAFYEVIELWDEAYLGGGKWIWGVYDTATDLQFGLMGIPLGMVASWLMIRSRQKLELKRA